MVLRTEKRLFLKNFHPVTCFSREDLPLTLLLYHSQLVASALGWVKITGPDSRFNLSFHNGGGACEKYNKAKRNSNRDFLLNLNMGH